MGFYELLIQAKAGNQMAKEELFLMYRPLILSRSFIKGTFSEDLYQELSKTFLNCIDKFLIDITEKEPKRD